MKVCHVTSAHNRYDGRIFQKECRSLAKKYDVYLLVNDSNDDELKNSVHIISTKFKPKNRFERFFKSKKSILKKALEIDADVYHLHDPDLLNIVKDLQKQKKKIIFDSHEDYPQLIKEKEWIPKIFRNLVSKYYENRERKILKKIDAVVSVTPHIVDRLKKINYNTYMITNYPILSTEKIVKCDDGHTICFAGGISSQWLHHNIIKAINEINNIKYILIGDNENSYFETIKTIKGFDKVEVIGKIPKIGRPIVNFTRRVINRICVFFRSINLFDAFKIAYIGPVDGHNFKALEKALKKAKNYPETILVHVKTKKGHGYQNSENDEIGTWHGVEPFDLNNGKSKKEKDAHMITFSQAFADALYQKMKEEKEQ